SGVSSSTLTLNQASDTTFSGTIADGIALKKAGAGTLTLSGDNSANTSGVTLSAGTLELGHNNALGGGALTIQGTPELKLGTDASGNALTVSNTLSLTSSVIVSSAHDGNELSGSISAFGQEIRKVGSGTLTLSGTNTEGSFFIVNVAEGKIIAGSDTALGATLAAEYAGFADYHKVRLSGGQLEVGSGVTLAQTNIEIALSSAYATTAAITGAADSALAADTVVTISSIDTADLAGVSLLTESAITRYDFKIADTLTDGLTEADFSLAQGLLDSGWDIAGYENGTLSLTLTVPEPSAFGLLAGAGALALVAARRRRTKKA
ncbi:MAG: autotransporter-associated beta strand repeat-containing protein, partial [Candidatus Spyradosoma sp.]